MLNEREDSQDPRQDETPKDIETTTPESEAVKSPEETKPIEKEEVDDLETEKTEEDQTASESVEEEVVDVETLRARVAENEQKKQIALDNIRALSKEMDKLREQRDELNKKSSEAFKQVNELKEKRDDSNKQIRELKAMREGVLTELKAAIERARALRTELAEEGKKANPRKEEELSNTIKQLEWQIQTTPGMNIEDERKLAARVDDLLNTLDEIKISQAKVNELRKLNKDISRLKGFLDDSWKQFNELVNTSQTRHQRMTEIYEDGKKSKEQADNFHKSFLVKAEAYRVHRKSLREANTVLKKSYPKFREIQKEQRASVQKERREKRERNVHEKAKEIQDKITQSKGKQRVALSLEEMRMLLDGEMLSLRDKDKPGVDLPQDSNKPEEK